MTILGDDSICIVNVRAHCLFIITLYHSKSCMLVKMSPEPVTALLGRKISATYPGATVNEIVFPVKCRYSKIIIDRVYFKAFKRVDRCTGPLPDIPYDIIKVPVFISVDRYTGGETFKIDVCNVFTFCCPLQVGKYFTLIT